MPLMLQQIPSHEDTVDGVFLFDSLIFWFLDSPSTLWLCGLSIGNFTTTHPTPSFGGLESTGHRGLEVKLQ